jgi:hypothetical protein
MRISRNKKEYKMKQKRKKTACREQSFNSSKINNFYKLIISEKNLENKLILSTLKKKNELVVSTKQKKNRPYRLHAKQFGMTYSQCPLLKEEIKTLIKDILIAVSRKRKRKIYYKFLRVANEFHEDNHLHSHLLIQLNKKTEFHNAREMFKIPFVNRVGIVEFYYPSFEPYFSKNNPEDWYRYIGAFGDYIDDGQYKPGKINLRKTKSDNIILFDKELKRLNELVLANEITPFEAKESFNKFWRSHDTVSYWEEHNLREYMSNDTFFKCSTIAIKRIIKEDINSFKWNDEKVKLIHKTIIEQYNSENPLAIVIEGKTQIGKSTLPELICRDILKVPYNVTKGDFDFSWENYNDNYKVNIYHDMGMEEINEKKLMHSIIAGRDNFKVREPYGKKRTLSGNKLNIFTVNKNKSFTGWIERNKEYGRFEWEYLEPNIINISLNEFDKDCPLFYKPDELKEMKLDSEPYKEKLKGANGRTTEILAKLMFGNDKVEVIYDEPKLEKKM